MFRSALLLALASVLAVGCVGTDPESNLGGQGELTTTPPAADAGGPSLDAGSPSLDAGDQVADAGPSDAGAPDCTPGDSQTCGSYCICEGQIYGDGGCEWPVCGSETCLSDGQWGPCEGPNTPIAMAFDGQPITVSPTPGHFELGQGSLATTDWPTAVTPWLAMDRDGDGLIGDGSELFGSMTRLANGARAHHGFEALAELDANRDGLLDARDPAWTSLKLWFDRDGDRAVGPGELVSLADAGVEAIALSYSNTPACDARGNCEVERAMFLWRDARGCQRRGAAVDLHLSAHPEPTVELVTAVAGVRG